MGVDISLKDKATVIDGTKKVKGVDFSSGLIKSSSRAVVGKNQPRPILFIS